VAVTDACPAADSITQPYGCTDYAGEWVAPNCPGGHFHAGVDFGSSRGGWAIYRSPVYALRSGLVQAVGIEYLGEQAVAVVHLDRDGRPVTLEYGHLDQALVAVGQWVTAGQQLGYLGTKGASSAPHLHLEARLDGPYQGLQGVIDPGPYVYFPPGYQSGPSADAKESEPMANQSCILANPRVTGKLYVPGLNTAGDQVWLVICGVDEGDPRVVAAWTGNDGSQVRVDTLSCQGSTQAAVQAPDGVNQLRLVLEAPSAPYGLQLKYQPRS
jgi:hypothetical protein